MMEQRKVSEKKIQEVSELKSLLNKYNIVGLARIEKVPAKAFHNLRNTLRKDVVIRVSKKRLIKFAFAEIGKPNLPELADQIEGITALLLTNMNPITLAQYLESKAVKGPAKPGDIAPIDIMVKEGDTKLAPGPIISELNQNLKLPTMIKNGTIHIRTDTVTHKVGQVIDAKQAQLLARLGVEPITVKLDFYAAWENGELIPTEVLHLDPEKILANVRLAVSEGLSIAMELGVVTSETIEPMVSKAVRQANAVAMELPVIFPDLIPTYLAKAVSTANYINMEAVGGGSAAPAAEKKDTKPAKEEKKKSDEDEMGDGLSSLFG